MPTASWNIDVPLTDYYGPDPLTLQWGAGAGDQIQQLVNELSAASHIAFDTETTGLNTSPIWNPEAGAYLADYPLYMSLAWGDRRATLHAQMIPYLGQIFADASKSWVMANAKYDTHIMANVGVAFPGRIIDTQVMHALLYADRPHNLKAMCQHIGGWTWGDFQDQFGKIGKLQSAKALIEKAEREDFERLKEYAANDAWGTLLVYGKLKDQLQNAQTYSLFHDSPPYIRTLWDLFDKVEVPYTKTLWRMERHGILVDKAALEAARPAALQGIAQLEREAVRMRGKAINLSSTAHLRDWLIGERKLKAIKLTKGGKTGNRQPSVDEAFLSHHADLGDEACSLVLQHRKQTKLHGTYLVGLHEKIDHEARIHTNYSQSNVRTGRLSCVAGWTPVTTEEGTTTIECVRPGDRVWTHEKRWRAVTKKVIKGVDYMFDVHLSCGTVLTCTAEHRVLTAQNTWAPVGDLLDEYLKRMGFDPDERDPGFAALPGSELPNDRENRRDAGDDVPQRTARAEDAHAGRRTPGASSGSVLDLEGGGEEPDVGNYGAGTPQLDRRVRRWLRLLDLSAQRQEAVRASSSHGPGIGVGGAAAGVGGAPHRREHPEQRAEQPGLDDAFGAPNATLLVGRGVENVQVTEVHYRGRFEVHDISVEEDESYEACGIFSHNSSDPNLQNIPKPDNDVWGLRKAFIAKEGYDLIVLDYKQLEMRLLAAAALEHPMIEMIHSGKDIHMGNAEAVFELPYADIQAAKKKPKSELTAYDRECLLARDAVKSIGFGIIYGMGEHKLANMLGISVDDARTKIRKLLDTYQAVERFTQECVQEAEQTGYAFTVMGRRRDIPEILSNNKRDKSRGARIATNTPIQGSAADVVKMAQLQFDALKYEYHYGCRMILQVHDELVFECPKEHSQEMFREISDVMAHPFSKDLAVRLETDGGIGPSWGAVK